MNEKALGDIGKMLNNLSGGATRAAPAAAMPRLIFKSPPSARPTIQGMSVSVRAVVTMTDGYLGIAGVVYPLSLGPYKGGRRIRFA